MYMVNECTKQIYNSMVHVTLTLHVIVAELVRTEYLFINQVISCMEQVPIYREDWQKFINTRTSNNSAQRILKWLNSLF